MVLQRLHLAALPEFRSGLFELQDEGSQLVAQLIRAKEGDEVLDFCAGSGGKSLAFASSMRGKGQIYLHDVRSSILLQAKKRLKRAGIQNAQIATSHSKAKQLLKKRMDWVLVDAPCTGTGTLRRNPDLKWKFTEETLQKLQMEQRDIFKEALTFLKPGGRIVYATCSLLKEENEEQAAYFQCCHNLKLIAPFFCSTPQVGEMDGFFAATFQS